MQILFLKAHVRSHQRKLKNGRIITVNSYETKKNSKARVQASSRTDDLFSDENIARTKKNKVPLISPHQLDFVNSQLSNDEMSTDEEMEAFFIKEGNLSPDLAKQVMSFRDQFLTDPMAMLKHNGKKFYMTTVADHYMSILYGKES